MRNVFTFKIGGEAGFGIMSISLTFSKLASRSGYHIYDYAEYPSLIRGGHNVVQVTVAEGPVGSQYMTTDFLVALNQQTIDLHQSELIAGSGLLYDSAQGMKVEESALGVSLFDIPFDRIAREVGGSVIMRNTVALGATMALLGGDVQLLKDMISEEFGDKKPGIVEKNHNTAQAGYDYAISHYSDRLKTTLHRRTEVKDHIVVTANDAIALGALAAGVQFVSIYPMTPTSGILHILALLQEKHGLIVKQPEDEIAALNMAIGASFAGARSLVATSGGGFCLMSEAYGLAGMTETPVVIIEGMRTSPATGLPTFTEQGDLRFVLHAHQGDFPRIILAAGDVEEAFHMTMKAFNLADIYQTPVVVLVDKTLCESHMSVAPFTCEGYEINRGKFITEKKEQYERYGDSEDGISPRSIPGVGNHFVANSDEHSVLGYSNEESDSRRMQMNKRMKKLQVCEMKEMEPPKLYGPPDSELTIVSWGSNKGAILEAMKQLPQVNFLHLTWINPFPGEAIKQTLRKAKQILNIECNYCAQMGGLIKERTGIAIQNHLLKYDGRPIYPEEIEKKVKELLR